MCQLNVFYESFDAVLREIKTARPQKISNILRRNVEKQSVSYSLTEVLLNYAQADLNLSNGITHGLWRQKLGLFF